ncbi:hypothetical protein B0O99DRAFT_595301 [Bisporella sp. PMI_857]|nr:hypothetical protein B0O99DRAFT_595301 [Bisporella sp. PMI_857]
MPLMAQDLPSWVRLLGKGLYGRLWSQYSIGSCIPSRLAKTLSSAQRVDFSVSRVRDSFFAEPPYPREGIFSKSEAARVWKPWAAPRPVPVVAPAPHAESALAPPAAPHAEAQGDALKSKEEKDPKKKAIAVGVKMFKKYKESKKSKKGHGSGHGGHGGGHGHGGHGEHEEHGEEEHGEEEHAEEGSEGGSESSSSSEEEEEEDGGGGEE